MAYEQFTNADFTTLAANYTSGGSSLTVTNSAGDNGGFPANPNFRVRVKDQITGNTKARFKVTAIPDSSTLTVTSEGLDANCVVGDIIENVLSTNGLLQLMADGCQEDTYANLSSGPLASNGPFVGAVCRQSDGPYDWRWNGSIWVPRVAGYGKVAVPPSSGWTWDNQGGGSFSNTYGRMRIIMPRSGAVTSRLLYRTAPSTPWKVTMLMRIDTTAAGVSGSTATNWGAGLAVRDAGGKVVSFYGGYDSNWNIIHQKWTSTTGSAANYALYQNGGGGPSFIISQRHLLWWRYEDDGTNIKGSWSLNGQDFTVFDSQLRGSFLTTGPVTYGPWAYVNGDQVEFDILSIVES